MMYYKKIAIVSTLFAGWMVLIATSPQTTISQVNQVQHEEEMKRNQGRLWIDFNLEDNQEIKTQDLMQTEIQIELIDKQEETDMSMNGQATTTYQPSPEQVQWQMVFYEPESQEVVWVEDLTDHAQDISDQYNTKRIPASPDEITNMLPEFNPSLNEAYMNYDAVRVSAWQLSLSLRPCPAQQSEWTQACLPCEFEQGSCQAHMYLIRQHHPQPAQDVMISVQQLYPKTHKVSLKINTRAL